MVARSGVSIFLVVFVAFWAVVQGRAVVAADLTFLGVDVTPGPGTYLVDKDVNVRAKPETNAKRIGGLEAGEIVKVIGKVPNSLWLAVIKDGEPFGFVYGTVLSPIVNGELDEDVTGELQVAPDLRCGFRIRYIGKTGGEEQAVLTSDYDATVVCERNRKRIRFPAQMFITEVPFDGSNKRRVFQLNVDLFDTIHGLNDIFSTIMLFDMDKGEVRFDRVSHEPYGNAEAELSSLPATNISRALASALEIAFMHWSGEAWDDIFEKMG